MPNARVLHIEDNPMARYFVKAILQRWSYHVDSAENAEQGRQLLLEKSYDLVLLDLHLPDMDGIEFSKNIRDHALLNKIRILGLSSDRAKGTKQACLSSGMNDFLTYPFDRTELKSKIQAQLGFNQVINGQDVPISSISELINQETEAGVKRFLELKEEAGRLMMKIYYQLQFQRYAEMQKLIPALRKVAVTLEAPMCVNEIEELQASIEARVKGTELQGHVLMVHRVLNHAMTATQARIEDAYVRDRASDEVLTQLTNKSPL